MKKQLQRKSRESSLQQAASLCGIEIDDTKRRSEIASRCGVFIAVLQNRPYLRTVPPELLAILTGLERQWGRRMKPKEKRL